MEKIYEVRSEFAGNIRRDFGLDAEGNVYLRECSWFTLSGSQCGPGAINATFQEGPWEWYHSHADARKPGPEFFGRPGVVLWETFSLEALQNWEKSR